MNSQPSPCQSIPWRRSFTFTSSRGYFTASSCFIIRGTGRLKCHGRFKTGRSSSNWAGEPNRPTFIAFRWHSGPRQSIFPKFRQSVTVLRLLILLLFSKIVRRLRRSSPGLRLVKILLFCCFIVLELFLTLFRRTLRANLRRRGCLPTRHCFVFP